MDVNVLPSVNSTYDPNAFVESAAVVEPIASSSANGKRKRASRGRVSAAAAATKPQNQDVSSPGSSRPSSPNDGLAPTRIRRQYTCESCTFRTVNPRDFLYHKRDVHGAKIKVVECEYCQYGK